MVVSCVIGIIKCNEQNNNKMVQGIGKQQNEQQKVDIEWDRNRNNAVSTLNVNNAERNGNGEMHQRMEQTSYETECNNNK